MFLRSTSGHINIKKANVFSSSSASLKYEFQSLIAHLCMSTFPNDWHVKPHFLIDMGLLSNCPACCGQLVKIPITLEPYGIFGSNFAYLFILTLSSHFQ